MENNTKESFRDRQMKNKEPLQFALYKGVTGKFGALRLSLKKAYQDMRNERPHGCVFLDMAPSIGPNVYDWENQKIIMALTATDISKIILYLRAPGHKAFARTDNKLKIYHDRGAGTNKKGQDVTSIEVNKPADRDNFFFSTYQRKGEVTKKATVTISADEAISIGTLLQTAIPKILAWD
jgi:hypothetical protein